MPAARDDLGAAVAADVHERSQRAIAVAYHDERNLAGAQREVRARLGELTAVARVLPGGREQPRALLLEQLGIGVPAVRQRVGHVVSPAAAAKATAWQAGSISGSSSRQRSSTPSRSASPDSTSGTAGVEAAAGRDARRVGRLPGQDLLLHLLDLGHDGEERACVGVLRRRQQLLGRPLLDDAAEVHHRHAVGDVPGEPEVVRDDEDADARLAHQLQHQREDLAANRGVERGHRLVGDEQARVQHHRAGDDHALALAARDLVRVAREEALRRAQAGAPQRVGHELLLVSLDLLDANALGDRLVDRLACVQGAGRVLEDHLGVPAVLTQRPAIAAERLATEAHLALVGDAQAHDRACERRLAAARLADKRDDLAAVHREVDAVDGPRDAVFRDR